MLAAMNGHKDVVLILTQKGADLNLVNNVSVHAHMLYDNSNEGPELKHFLFNKMFILNCLKWKFT